MVKKIKRFLHKPAHIRLKRYFERDKDLGEFFSRPDEWRYSLAGGKKNAVNGRVSIYLMSNEVKYRTVFDYGKFDENIGIWICSIHREGESVDVDPVHSTEITDGFHAASCILDGIAQIAERFGFDYVALNPLAEPGKGNLNQEQLEKWYRRHLGGRKYKYKTSGEGIEAMYKFED